MDALLFVPVAIAISLTPGPNNFCGLNNGIRAGVGPAMIATVGRAAAFAIFLTVSAVGLGAMLLASEAAFTAVKWVGAAYLFWLGWKAWHSREFSGLALEDAPGSGQASGQQAQFHLRALIAQEFLLGITNPKAIILFAAIFPQFIDPAQPAARQFLVLGSIYLGSEFVSTAVYASSGRQIRRFIRTSRGVARLNKATGGFFMGAGGLLLATNR
ncbi:lysine transporter LysE [Acidovorax sp. HMWF018]|uniref:LysE family translocator n=1 Tax=Acidovorax sp. HMWF018 TaxID=2056855 RepID=UPI000D3925AD|nr:LysE family transporter [Acidovorax sp. HMWF018]PTT39557.1 lysine transporter LysE [Acidovorax sp. HMWF018]